MQDNQPEMQSTLIPENMLSKIFGMHEASANQNLTNTQEVKKPSIGQGTDQIRQMMNLKALEARNTVKLPFADSREQPKKEEGEHVLKSQPFQMQMTATGLQERLPQTNEKAWQVISGSMENMS